MALMDADGILKANTICDRIDSVTLDTELSNKIIDEGNLVLDETGMLATKTREGLKEISDAVTVLFNKKEELKGVVRREGNQLRNNYDAYVVRMREQSELKEQLENSEQVGGSAGGSSSTISKTGAKRDIIEKILE